MSKDRAFELLLSQNYSSLIVTIECIGVSIYHADNKQLLDEVFVISRIIKVEVRVISRSRTTNRATRIA